MIKVLDASKTLTELVSDTSNGLGQLTVMNDSVTEELNGIYELEFDVLTSDKHYEDLKNNRLVKVNVDETGNEQIFRVYNIGEPINLVSHIKCQHITYDLAKVVVKPFSATGAVNIKNALITNMLGTYPFTTWTDITNTTSTFTNDIPRSFRECLGGYEGSVLDVLRPEYEWDNLQVKICARRGSDHGTRIAYGKNLTDFQQEENNENVYDAVYGYAVVDEVTYQASSIYNKTGASFPKVLNVDFSNRYETGQTPTAAELLQYATDYATNNPIEVPSVNIKISFVPLWQTEEYKNIAPLERVFLGDTVHVFFDKLNVEASARVIKTVWIPSHKRYESIELGSARSNLNTVITDTVKQETESIVDSISVDTGFIERELDDLSRLIINGLGLYRTEVEIAGGGVRYILHNKPELADSDVQYYMSAAGIMVSTDYGATWDAGYDTTTGELFTQALSTIVLKALEIYGSTITFGDVNDKYITASVYTDDSDIAQGVSFDGSGTIRMQPQDRFYVNNLATDGVNMYNQILMNKQGSAYNSNLLELKNLDDEQNYLLANFIELDAHLYSTPTSNPYNRVILRNYSTASGTRYGGNYLSLQAYADSHSVNFYNYKPSTVSSTANRFTLSATATTNTTGIYNHRLGSSTDYANYIQLLGNDSSYSIALANYPFQGTVNANANRMIFSASATEQAFDIYNNKINNSNQANRMRMSVNSTESRLYLINCAFDTSNSNIVNQMSMVSDSSGNTITIENRDSSFGLMNSITLKSDKTMVLFCKSDMRLWSEGAIRLAANTTSSGSSSGTQQDIYVEGYSVKLQANSSGRIYLYWGSTRYYIGRATVDGTNVLTWTSA